MKKVPATVEQKITVAMESFIAALSDTLSSERDVHLRLLRSISSANHMLNVALAMAASQGITKEAVDKALELGETTADTLVQQAIASARSGGAA